MARADGGAGTATATTAAAGKVPWFVALPLRAPAAATTAAAAAAEAAGRLDLFLWSWRLEDGAPLTAPCDGAYWFADQAMYDAEAPRWAAQAALPPWKRRRGDLHIQLFGRTADGLTATVTVRGYRPWFHVQLPDGWGAGEAGALASWVEGRVGCGPLRRFRGRHGGDGDGEDGGGAGGEEDDARTGVAWELVERAHSYGFAPDPADPGRSRRFRMAKLRFPSLSAYHRAAKLLRSEAVTLPPRPPARLELFDAIVPAPTAFMLDLGLQASGWVSARGALRAQGREREVASSHDDVEVFLDLERGGALGPAVVGGKPMETIAPLRVVSWDAENWSRRKGYLDGGRGFPQAAHGDETTMVGMSFAAYGSSVVHRAVVTRLPADAGTVASFVAAADAEAAAAYPAPLPPVVVHVVADERELWDAVRDAWVYGQPEVEATWNGYNHDWPFALAEYDAAALPPGKRGGETAQGACRARLLHGTPAHGRDGWLPSHELLARVTASRGEDAVAALLREQERALGPRFTFEAGKLARALVRSRASAAKTQGARGAGAAAPDVAALHSFFGLMRRALTVDDRPAAASAPLASPPPPAAPAPPSAGPSADEGEEDADSCPSGGDSDAENGEGGASADARAEGARHEDLPEAAAAELRRAVRASLGLPSEAVPPLDAMVRAVGAARAAAFWGWVERAFSPATVRMLQAPVRPAASAPRFYYAGRAVAERCQPYEKKMETMAKGSQFYTYLPMSGRANVDLMLFLKDFKKPPSNALAWAMRKWTKLAKVELDPEAQFAAYESGDPARVAQVAAYCARDTEGPWAVATSPALRLVETWVALSRACATPVQTILNGGQQTRVFSEFTRNAWASGRAVHKGASGWPSEAEVLGCVPPPAVGSKRKRAVGYEGATVLEPRPGYYGTDEPVATLDFESLYPSIMRACNLCPSMLVSEGDLAAVKAAPGALVETSVLRHPDGKGGGIDRAYHVLLTEEAVTFEMLQGLVARRKAVKAQMAGAETPAAAAVFNALQDALKVICNSTYGFFGVDEATGMLSCKPVAAITTQKGRAFIEGTKRFVEARFPGSSVVYGDSVAPWTPVLVRAAPPAASGGGGGAGGAEEHASTDVSGLEGAGEAAAALAPGLRASPWHPRWVSIAALYHSNLTGDVQPWHGDKEAVDARGLEVWADGGWTPLRRVIRHALRPDKGMLEVTTLHGEAVVTADHSLLRPDGTAVKPSAVALGSPLLHERRLGAALNAVAAGEAHPLMPGAPVAAGGAAGAAAGVSPEALEAASTMATLLALGRAQRAWCVTHGGNTARGVALTFTLPFGHPACGWLFDTLTDRMRLPYAVILEDGGACSWATEGPGAAWESGGGVEVADATTAGEQAADSACDGAVEDEHVLTAWLAADKELVTMHTRRGALLPTLRRMYDGLAEMEDTAAVCAALPGGQPLPRHGWRTCFTSSAQVAAAHPLLRRLLVRVQVVATEERMGPWRPWLLAAGEDVEFAIAPWLLAAPMPLVRAYMLGGISRCGAPLHPARDAVGQAALAGIATLVQRVRDHTGGGVGEEDGPLPPTSNAAPVTRVRELRAHERPSWVYDLETGSGHFAVGPGDLVVHNTDSVFVSFGRGKSVAEVHELGTRAAAMVTHALRTGEIDVGGAPWARRVLQAWLAARGAEDASGGLVSVSTRRDFTPACDVIKLAMEKVCCPLLLTRTKKAYSMRKHEASGKVGPDGAPLFDTKVAIKGQAAVRRDVPAFIVRAGLAVGDALMNERPDAAATAKAALQRVLDDLVADRLPLADYVMSKSLGTEYEGVPTQLAVVNKMKARGDGDVPSAGMRVDFVVCRGAAGASVAERAEHPAHVARAGLPIDRLYYLGMLQPSMAKVFELVDREWMADVLAVARERLTDAKGRVTGRVAAIAAALGLAPRAAAPATSSAAAATGGAGGGMARALPPLPALPPLRRCHVAPTLLTAAPPAASSPRLARSGGV